MIITIKIKNVYGNEMIYPVCDKAKMLVELTGKKTFTPYAIRILKELGYVLCEEVKVL